MGVTPQRVYECDLCGDFEGTADGRMPPNWRRIPPSVDDMRWAACEACVAAVLKAPVDALFAAVALGCNNMNDPAEERDHVKTARRAIALRFAEQMVREEVTWLDDAAMAEQVREWPTTPVAEETPE